MALDKENSTIIDVLEAFGNEMQQSIEASARGAGNYISGDLANHVNFSATILGNQFKFQLVLEDYWDYVNTGVNGTKTVKNDTPYSYKQSSKIPFYFAKKFMNDKGLYVTPGTTLSSIASRKTFKAGSKDSQAFAMARSWKEKGTKGTHFFDKVVNENRMNKLRQDLYKAGADDFGSAIGDIFKQI